jgi:hypothetical protein
MLTPGNNRSGGLAEAARHVAEHATTIARLELRLAAQEVRRKVVALGVGIGLLLGAALLGTLALLLLVGAGVAGIAAALPVWLSLLVVGGGLLLLAGPLAVLGLVLLGRGSPPLPERALAEARLTREALRNGRH